MVDQAKVERARRKARTGTVTSDKMDKTVTVSLVRRYAHPVYGKQVTRTKQVKARNLEGDAAAKEAVRRSPADQRNTVRSLIKDLKKQGAQIAKAVKEAEKARKKAGAGGGEPGTNFGPLPGQGQQGTGQAAP